MGKFSFLDNCYYRLDVRHRMKLANNRVLNKPSMKLTLSERNMFDSCWTGGTWTHKCHEFYKGFGLPFDEKYVPNDYYDFAEHVLNHRWAAFFLQHKCNLKYFIPESNRPKTILQKIDGHYVFEDNTEISKEEATLILKTKEAFIWKIALGSGGGRGVKKVCWEKETDQDEILRQLLKPEDMIVQEVLPQNDFMSGFNPDSVNTFRLLSLNINEKCTVLSSFVRMGAKGAYVDNLCSGGGALVGVDQMGVLSEWGIKKDYSKVYEAPSGISFKGLRVPDWIGLKNKIIAFHRLIPYANLIGWDIAINKDGEPVVIEINLDNAEVEAHQVFNGPVFGDRFDEVRQYVENKKPLLKHAMITI